MLPTSSRPQNNEEFLKLKYKVTFKDWKIEVGVVLFSRSDANRSTFNLPAKLIDKLMEYTARDWVRTYVDKIIGKTADAKIFIKKINNNGGVRKSELIDLLIDTKMKEITYPHTVPDQGKLPSLNFLINFIVDNFNHATGSNTFDERIVDSYINYMDPKRHNVTLENVAELNCFFSAFQTLKSNNPNSPLVVKNAGRVKFLINKLNYFKRNLDPSKLSKEKKRINEIIKARFSLKRKLNDDTKNLLSTFVTYMQEGIGRLDPEEYALLIRIADSKDVVALLDLKVDEEEIQTLRNDMHIILSKLNDDLIQLDNIPFRKDTGITLMKERIKFYSSSEKNEVVKLLWESEFVKFFYNGDIAIDENSYAKLKDLSDFALSDFESFCTALPFLDSGECVLINIYLKKLAADLVVFESECQEIEK